MPHIPPKIDWKDSAVTGHPAKSSRFERDKFTGYLFAPFVDALTDDRRHIEMRGCRYTAPPLTSTGSVVYRTLRGYCNKFCKCTKGRRFHNHVGAFRRKADYTQMKRGMKSCCPLVSDECCFYDATEWILSLELFSVTVSRSADPYLLIKNSATRTKNRPSGAAIRYEITGWHPSGPCRT